MIDTSTSLLERLRGDDPAAWERFVQLYSPLLCHWARRLGASGPDVADLVQDIFTILVEELPAFRYNAGKRFRGWLWTILRNKWNEKRRRAVPIPIGAGSELNDVLAVPDPVLEFDEAEYRDFLIKRAFALAELAFHPNTWQAFWLTAIEGRAPAAVAVELGLSENAVYLARSRVLRHLREDLDGLLD